MVQLDREILLLLFCITFLRKKNKICRLHGFLHDAVESVKSLKHKGPEFYYVSDGFLRFCFPGHGTEESYCLLLSFGCNIIEIV